MTFKRIIIVCGHYGSGKTTFSLNLAKKLSVSSRTGLVDLDIVNPYFRSSDYGDVMEKAGIEVIAPNFAGSTLDTPSLSPRISGAIDCGFDHLIIDAGGDDAGATALGCFREDISRRGYDMLYVVNMRRERVADTAGALEIMKEIETASGLNCTGIVNNTHLCGETEAEVVTGSLGYAEDICRASGLPLIYTCYPDFLGEGIESEIENPYSLEPLVKTPW